MWLINKKRIAPEKISQRIDKLLLKIGNDRTTIFDLATEKHLSKIKVSEVTRSDLDLLEANIDTNQKILVRIASFEFAIFFSLLLVSLDIDDKIRLMAFEFSASNVVLAGLLFALSTVHIVQIFSHIDLAIRKMILKEILNERPDFDKSMLAFTVKTGKFDVFTPWSTQVLSGDFPMTRRYIAMLLFFLLPLLFHVGILLFAVPTVTIYSAWILVTAEDWAWPYAIVFLLSVFGTFSRFTVVSILSSWRFNFTAEKMKRNFWLNVSRFGFDDAFAILVDEVDAQHSETRYSQSLGQRTGLPVARLKKDRSDRFQ